MQRNNESKVEGRKGFIDENGEECCPASLVASALMVIVSIAGTIGLIGLLWFSRCFAHFLKTGGWTWH